MTKAIKINNLKYSYDSDQNLFDDFNLDIETGEWVALVGHNGSGKSTLAKLILGLIAATGGTISVFDDILSPETVYRIREQIGMVFQNPDNQFVGSTVQDDVAFGLENIGLPRDEMIIRIDDALKRVGMEDFKLMEPSRLSGGQKQRVAIAGVLALRPQIIVLDEATSMLDPKGRQEVLNTVKSIKEESKMTVISITHDINEANEADRIFVMNKGKIQYVERPEVIFKLGDELIDLGLTVPFAEQLKNKLSTRGLNVPDEYMSEERLVEWLWKYNLKM